MKTHLKLFMTVVAFMASAMIVMATNVTLKVVDSQGNAISGVPIQIFKSNCCGIGTYNTDVNGEVTVDLANYTFQGAGYVFTARYAYSSSAYAKSITSADEGLLIHTFQTEAAVMKVADCTGAAVVGATVSYFISNSGGGPVGTVGASGIVEKELFPGTYSFTATINKTKSQVNVDITTASGAGVDHLFTPVKVNVVHSGTTSVWIPNVGSASIVNSYMFPGVYNFNFGLCTFPIEVTGCTFEKVANVIKVLDHNGNPIAGATARGGVGASFGTWHVAGSTNANGCLLDLRPLPASASGYSYEARVNATTAVVGPLMNNKYTFNTQLLTLRLETCLGDPLSGGHVRWGHGTNYGTSHFIGGNTNAAGETSAEMFPGTYSFEMGYKATTDFKISHNFPADGATIVFKTTKVTLRYNSSIRYGGAAGQSNHFIKPSMELLPGATVKFEFSVGGTVVDIPITGCEISKVMSQVKNESGGKVAGAKLTPAIGGSWQAALAGVTDANGCLFADFNPAWTKFKAGVGNSGQEQLKAALEVNGYLWTTQVLRVNLKDHAGNLITDGTGSLLQGGGTWVNLGNFSTAGYVDVSTFPVASAKYKASYNCTSQQITGIAVVAGAGIQQFDFQTGQVFGSCITQYQGCGWSTFVDGMELMPGTRTYRNPTQTVSITAGSVTYLTCPTPAKTDFEAGTTLVAYPNPATESVSFLNYEGNFEVYNSTGQLMYSGSDATISIADWQSGLYIVRTQDQVVKFIKK